jgi:hypothetical protein
MEGGKVSYSIELEEGGHKDGNFSTSAEEPVRD